MKNAYLAGMIATAFVAGTAGADVKQGVDAWARGDYKAAVDVWRPLAAGGDADAQFNLGQAYKLGRGLPASLPTAIEWFRKAAAQGHNQAIDNYGLALFQDGKKAEALPWLEKSAARGERRTQLVLGTMLFNADGVARDWVRAYALVTRSSQQGLPQASQTLAQMDQYIPEAQRQEGLTLARKYEADARALATRLPPVTAGTTVSTATPRPATTSPARIASTPPPSPAPGTTAAPATAVRPAAPPASARAAAVAPPTTAAPAPAPASNGRWRIQLGAFRDGDNARNLWAKVGSRTGGNPSYVQAGGVTRLQATGFASRAAAQAACTKSGVSCVVVAP
ncbi:SPOR domain-containing protein [Sphingomonas sp. IC-11]|uniref:SPOR domain-containing protein n=1 Tax=Sphingomonas sp. IC-11 TaxID=2898528 RepID=UPI001E565201|nr:SPOR domain-containing protein [Sphingomonas sp. IC-11]MCD2315943.1 SPOR domain-containing protein [Sphingomonas sp. IC-11]